MFRIIVCTILLLLPLISVAEEKKEQVAPTTTEQLSLRDHYATLVANHGFKYQWEFERADRHPPLRVKVKGPIYHGAGFKLTVNF